jgi:hypothetical protein
MTRRLADPRNADRELCDVDPEKFRAVWDWLEN